MCNQEALPNQTVSLSIPQLSLPYSKAKARNEITVYCEFVLWQTEGRKFNAKNFCWHCQCVLTLNESQLQSQLKLQDEGEKGEFARFSVLFFNVSIFTWKLRPMTFQCPTRCGQVQPLSLPALQLNLRSREREKEGGDRERKRGFCCYHVAILSWFAFLLSIKFNQL